MGCNVCDRDVGYDRKWDGPRTVASGKSWHGFGACDENIKRQIDNHNKERKL